MSKKTVFVGMSGGVDSSVAALRLQKQGYQVVGVFIKVWHPDFLMCDAEAAYRDEVAKYFISEYTLGRTPNPDVMCNRYVKFGAFIEFAKKRGADYIATGHYAQKLAGEIGDELHRGLDGNKDQ